MTKKNRKHTNVKSMDEARDATKLERAEANTTTTILNEKKAAKQKVLKAEKKVKKAKKVLAKATKSKSKEKIVQAKVDLQAAQKVAVEAEANAELAGKDQRQAEQVQMAAQAKADSAEMVKSSKYRETKIYVIGQRKRNWLRIKKSTKVN